MDRRKFLRIAGGGLVLAAGSGALFAATRTPAQALAPWSQAEGASYADPRMRALSYAILAPNPHNRQPWLVTLEGDNRVILRFDTGRQLPHTDPLDRQLTIGLGCFLELMVMAAQADGHRVSLDLFPDGTSPEGLDTRPVAVATFRPTETQPDPLWSHVLDRRSNKEPYDTVRPVPAAALNEILAAGVHGPRIGGSIDPADIAFWREVTERALRIEIETPHTYRESVDLFRIGKREVNANPDGIDFTGVMFDSLRAAGLFTREAAVDTSSIAYTSGLDAVLENCRTAMGHVWMVTDTNTRQDQIASGRDWLRVNLAATAAGLGFQPLSQALQEYPEVAGPYAETHARLAPNGGTVQMLARIGYGPTLPPSPRWPLDAKVRSA